MEPKLAPQGPEVVKDERAIKEVVSKVKSQGLFDQFRKECIADVDTKPAYHNLLQRVESYVAHFLQEQKWSSIANKNQLRETLRRQLNNSGMMHNGVERIIEQVVNPKILLGIKPKIDEAVCDHLGIDLKARQEEQQRKKQEQQRLFLQQQQQLHQQSLQAKINQKAPPGDGFDPAKNQLPFGHTGPWGPGMANFPTPSVQGIGNPIPGMPGNPQAMGNFPGIMQPFSMMGGWPPGFNPAIHPMIPGHPMIPAFPGAGIPPAARAITRFNTNISPVAGSVSVSTPASVIPDLSKPPPGLPKTLTSSTASTRSPVVPPGTSSVAPAPPGSVPPPPGTVPVVPPASSSLVPPGTSPTVPTRAVPTTPTIPALISHTLAKVSEDKLTPEKIAVFKTAAAFITKTVNNAQSTPGADLATIFSPQVVAEAMMEESGKPLTKHELRAARRKERMKAVEKLKAERDSVELGRENMKMEDKEDPIPPSHNLMDVFQAAEDVSDDEEALDMLMDVDETEDKNKTGIILSDESDKEGADQPPTSQPGKRYNFAWDVDINPEELSDVTVSSIHTSDISSYEEDDVSSSDTDSEVEKNKQNEKTVEESIIDDNGEPTKDRDICPSPEENVIKSQEDTEEVKDSTAPASKEDDVLVERSKEDSTTSLPDFKSSTAIPIVKETTKSVQPLPSAKPRKLLALSSHYSDSDDDETREERKSRIAKEKEERYLKRQQRRAELDAKRKEREEEKARLKEERKKQKELAAEANQTDVSGATSETAMTEDRPMGTTATEEESTPMTTPKKRKNKAELKEQLLQQKVMERKAALRRRRTRNRRYASDEFTSIFSERKTLNQGYSDNVINSEDLVTFDGAVEVVEMTVDQECVVETVNEVIETTEDQAHTGQEGQSTELVLQCPSPYSDISDRSMSEKSDTSKADNVSVDKVSSEEELDEDLENAEVVEEMALKVKEEEATSSHPVLETEESCLQQDGDNSMASEPVSPRSRISTHSKSALSQDEFENASSTADEKSSLKNSGASQVEDDKESRISLDRGMASPVKMADFESSSSAKQEDADVLNTDEKVSSPKDIMANLELEPVSDEDSSLGALSEIEKEQEREEEEGEERDSEGEMRSPVESSSNKKTPPQKSDAGIIEDENASDEGEIKSDSEEEIAKKSPPQAAQQEEGVQRQLARKPIELVDFGEAEKRARESRVFYSESERRRHLNATSANYRGPYTWQNPATSSSANSYSSSSGRYVLDPSSPARSKSPGAAFDAESEASSHSRSSVRVRDDVPPPYPIEGVSRKHKSSNVSTQGSSGQYNPVSPPSLVSSSSSSSRSRHSQSRSKSRSRSHFSSRSSSSDSYSSGSLSSLRKKKISRKKRKKKHRSASVRSKDCTPSARSHSPSSRMSFTDHLSPPHRVSDASQTMTSASDPQAKQGHLSSGNESISSDELPYFPDEEAEKLGNPSKVKHRSLSGQSSSSNNSSSTPSKPPDSPGKASISSSELIYSPSRKRVPSEDSDASLSTEQKSDRSKIKCQRKSSSKVSESSEDDLMSPRVESNVVYSPHRPSSPTIYPLLPDDMSGFQPPLPQESPDHPPPPFNEPPPLPPLPPEDGILGSPHSLTPLSPPLPPPLDEVEEGECPSSPEFEEHLSQFPSHDKKRETSAGSVSEISHSHHKEENVDLAEGKVSSEGSPVAQSATSVTSTVVCSFHPEDSVVQVFTEAGQTNPHLRPLTPKDEVKPTDSLCDVNEKEDTSENGNQSTNSGNEEMDVSNSSDKVLADDAEKKLSEATASEVQTSKEKKSCAADIAVNLSTDTQMEDVKDSDLAGSNGLKRRAEDFDSSPPSKRQKEDWGEGN